VILLKEKWDNFNVEYFKFQKSLIFFYFKKNGLKQFQGLKKLKESKEQLDVGNTK